MLRDLAEMLDEARYVAPSGNAWEEALYTVLHGLVAVPVYALSAADWAERVQNALQVRDEYERVCAAQEDR